MLLLFDIDGTLLRGGTRAHAAALHAALREVHGVDTREIGHRVPPAGRTDGEIARAILLEAGLSWEQIDAGTGAVREATCRILAETIEPDLSSFVVPGIPSLLEWLSSVDGVRLALVTGNYEVVARLKLRAAARLDRYFPTGQGGFGSDSEDRLDLPAIARRRAGEGTGLAHPRERTIVIGDTPRDIACARADGVRCIAVTTGPYGAEALSAADVVAGDAVALREVLERTIPGRDPEHVP